MKKEKKLVLRKLTVTSLDADKLNSLRGGRAADSIRDCTEGCGGGSGNWSAVYVDGMCGCYSQYFFVTCRC